jgi:hypothetical protein
MLQKELIAKKDYSAVGGEISHESAHEMIRTWQNANPNENPAYYLGRNIIEKILAQPGCVGMRFYYGINEQGQKTLVYMGIDANGQDIVKSTVVSEFGMSSQEAILADLIGLGGTPWDR